MRHVIYFKKKRVSIEDYEAQAKYYDKWIQEHHYDKNLRFRQSFFFQITQHQNSAKVWMEYIQDLEKEIKELTGGFDRTAFYHKYKYSNLGNKPKSNVRHTIVRRSGGPQ